MPSVTQAHYVSSYGSEEYIYSNNIKVLEDQCALSLPAEFFMLCTIL